MALNMLWKKTAAFVLFPSFYCTQQQQAIKSNYLVATYVPGFSRMAADYRMLELSLLLKTNQPLLHNDQIPIKATIIVVITEQATNKLNHLLPRSSRFDAWR